MGELTRNAVIGKIYRLGLHREPNIKPGGPTGDRNGARKRKLILALSKAARAPCPVRQTEGRGQSHERARGRRTRDGNARSPAGDTVARGDADGVDRAHLPLAVRRSVRA